MTVRPEPTPAEIAERAEQVRAEWPEEVERRRRVNPPAEWTVPTHASRVAEPE